ncbi:MAG TPA: hypothetical protein VH597_08620 [Verrucomicrobiae bacterium]|jgi:hypothetical protein|nr:hypothetical protein [Verrucomicrobiae bacterium]
MDLSLESALNAPGTPAEPSGNIAGRALDEWNAAYAKVESYFHALRIQNKVLLGRLVIHVLKRAMRRAPQEPQLSATELAGEEMDAVVTEWFGQVLQEAPVSANHMLSTRGRLALLLVDMPGKWQEQFLHPPPWPEEFIKAMREAYLRAGPDFQLAKMAPRPLDLGPIATLSNLSMLPFRKMIIVWCGLMLLFVALFIVTHNSQQNEHLLNEFLTWVRNLFH